MKKIAHISLTYDPNISSGVLSNTKSKLAALNKLGISNYDFYLINDFIEKDDDGIKLIKLSYKNFFFQYYYKLFNKYKLIKQVIDLNKYDIIIIRYPFADKSIIDFVSIHKVFFEFHSTTQSSIESYFILKHPNFILMKLNGIIRLILEKLYSQVIYKKTLGFITVTKEIKNIESQKTINKNFKTISNGVNTEIFPQSKFKKFDGINLNLIMICSMESYWHGIERLIKSIDNYKGNEIINLYLVGNFPNSKYKFQDSRNKIYFAGKLCESEISILINDMNLGIGTLGLYKKNMQEAAILKVREYVSRGIPFIKAYYDTDIDNIPELKPYYLNFSNDESLLDFKKIIEFLTSLSKSEIDIPSTMHKIALDKLDWTIKMKEYVDFVNLEV